MMPQELQTLRAGDRVRLVRPRRGVPVGTMGTVVDPAVGLDLVGIRFDGYESLGAIDCLAFRLAHVPNDHSTALASLFNGT